jgi:hypothetical protein
MVDMFKAFKGDRNGGEVLAEYLGIIVLTHSSQFEYFIAQRILESVLLATPLGVAFAEHHVNERCPAVQYIQRCTVTISAIVSYPLRSTLTSHRFTST